MPQNVILLVDDDPVFTRFTEKILTEGGMKVVPAFNKAEGLTKFEEHHPSCVILDIFLPDGSGVDMIKPFRAAAPKVPIIMVSGQSEVDDVVRAMMMARTITSRSRSGARNFSLRSRWSWRPPGPGGNWTSSRPNLVPKRSTSSSFH